MLKIRTWASLGGEGVIQLPVGGESVIQPPQALRVHVDNVSSRLSLKT